MTPEELSLIQAQAEGQQAGEFSHGASMNPYPDGTPENSMWENARFATIGYRLNSKVKLAGEVC